MYEKLKRILEVLQECELALNLDKYELYKQSILFVGQQIHADGIYLLRNQMKFHTNVPETNQCHRSENVFGLSGYLRKFVAGYVIISVSLQILLRKDKKCQWNTPQQDGFEKLRYLTSNPVITSYCLEAEHELETDTSGIGLARVLLQR